MTKINFRYDYLPAVYRINAIEFKNESEKEEFKSVTAGSSFVGIRVYDKYSGADICDILCNGDEEANERNIILLHNGIKQQFDCSFDFITHENAHEFEDLDEEHYELLGSLKESPSFVIGMLQYIISSELCQYIGDVSEKALKSIESSKEKSTNGTDIDGVKISYTEVLNRLQFLSIKKPKIFKDILSLIINTTD